LSGPRSEGPTLNTKARSPLDTTILVCEDDEQLGILVEMMLSDHGYHVLLAARAEQALEVAAEHANAIDVLVTDVELPQMSGPELVGHLQAKLPALPVLLLSGYPAEAIAGPPLSDGDYAFLQKPFSETSLLQKIQGLVESSQAPRGNDPQRQSASQGGESLVDPVSLRWRQHW
jgi:DNA-binding NtrC family response regulator